MTLGYVYFGDVYREQDVDFPGIPRYFRVIITLELADRISRKIELAKKIKEVDPTFKSLVFGAEEECLYYRRSNDAERDIEPGSPPVYTAQRELHVAESNAYWSSQFECEDGVCRVVTAMVSKLSLEEIKKGQMPTSDDGFTAFTI